MALSKAFYLTLMILFDTFGALAQTATSDDWTYLAQDKWPPICLTGKRQSPMPINTYEALYDPSLAAFRFVNFNYNVNGTLTNSGARGIRWQVDLPDDDQRLPKIAGGGLNGDYYIRYLDFRWAGSDCQGSDHFIDFKPLPLEVQLTTFRSSKSNDNDMLVTDTIAVFSYFFQYSNDNNGPFTPLFNAVDKISQAGAFTYINITLSAILPTLQQTSQYYRYNGSLSTPPCSENAVWTLFFPFQPISKAQMAIFRKVQALGGGPVVTAYREPQQPNTRHVVTNIRTQTGTMVTGGSRSGKSESGENAAPGRIHADAVLLTAAAIFAATMFAH